MLADMIDRKDGKATLHIRVTPKAAANRIKIERQSDGSRIIRIYVTSVPEDGKANKEVIKLLAKELGIPKSALTIAHGLTSREKSIHISGI
jgi:uncharacterized protein (TIGR00251 family)